MSFKKRVIVGISTCVIALSALGVSVSAYGDDNNIGYSFTVKANQEWSYAADPQYRGPSGTNVPWKVNFTYSAEGTGTYMDYFLAGTEWFSPSKLSDYKRVQQGSGAKYYHAYDTAYNKDVRLAARNNNYVNASYQVSGYWDEEAAKHRFDDWN